MKVDRNGWFLGLLFLGLALIAVSRFVPEGGMPAAPASGPAEPAPLAAPAATAPAATAPASGPAQPVRLPAAGEHRFPGLVVDHLGHPVARARVEALSLPPAGDPAEAPRLLARLLLAAGEAAREGAGRPGFDPEERIQTARAALGLGAVPAGPLEPHAESDGEGRFELGPLPRPTCWLRARLLGQATPAPVRAEAGREALLVVAAGASLVVAVAGEGDRPLAGCPVRLLDLSHHHRLNLGALPGLAAASYAEGRTGGDGRFTFLGLAPPGPFLAAALPPEASPVLGRPLSLQAGSTGLVRLAPGPGAGLRVTVTDEEGRPLAGALVRCTLPGPGAEAELLIDPPRGRTDAAGACRWPILPAGELLVEAGLPGREPRQARVFLKPREETTLVLTLPAGLTLVGRVADEEGRPVAGALVAFLALDAAATGLDLTALVEPVLLADLCSACRTDRGGTYLLGGLPPRPLTLIAQAPGFAPTTRRGLRPRPGRAVDFVLSRAGAVAGRVVGPDGRPRNRFHLECWQMGPMGMRHLVARQDVASPAGQFEQRDLATGTLRLRVGAEGLAPAEVEVEIDPARTLRLALPIRLHDPALLAGLVVGETGLPAAGALVRASLAEPGMLGEMPGFSLPPVQTRADRQGRFHFTGLPAGAWSIAALVPGVSLARPPGPVAVAPDRPVRDLVLRLEPLASLAGAVFDREGRPEGQAPVLLFRTARSGFRQVWTRTDPEGRFVLHGLEPGSWQALAPGADMAARALGLQRQLREAGQLDLGELLKESRMAKVELLPGQAGEVTLGQPRGERELGSLAGRVHREGRPLAGAMATLLRLDAEAATPRFAATDAAGEFRLERLPASRYRLVLQGGATAGARQSRTVEVEEGRECRVEVEFGGATLAGTLKADGACGSLAARPVQVRATDREEGGLAYTDGEGRFQVPGLRPGAYLLFTAALPGMGAGTPIGRLGPVELAGGAIQPVELVVRPAAGLKGSIEGGPPGVVELEARVEGWPDPFPGRTEPDGTFRLSPLPPGRARIDAAGGDRRGTIELILPAGEETVVVIRLQGRG